MSSALSPRSSRQLIIILNTSPAYIMKFRLLKYHELTRTTRSCACFSFMDMVSQPKLFTAETTISKRKRRFRRRYSAAAAVRHTDRELVMSRAGLQIHACARSHCASAWRRISQEEDALLRNVFGITLYTLSPPHTLSPSAPFPETPPPKP